MAIEVVYPPGWNTSPRIVGVPNNVVKFPAPQIPEANLPEDPRGIIAKGCKEQNLSTAIEKMREAVYITPPTETNSERAA